MELIQQIIQENTEFVKHLKEHLDVVNLQFLNAHMYIKRGSVWTRQDTPEEIVYNSIKFDSYAKELLKIIETPNCYTGPHILNTDLRDWYILELKCDDDIESPDECKNLVLKSYNRNDHISRLVGYYCLYSIWHKELTSEEQTKAQESLILDLKNLLNYNVDSFKEFDTKIGNLTVSCEILKLDEIRLKKVNGVFGECVTYYDNSTSLTNDKTIDIPLEIKWMGRLWKVIDIANGFFDNCNEVERIIIPDDLQTFNWSFWNCQKLKIIATKISDKSKYYELRKYLSYDGILFCLIESDNNNECELIAYPNMHSKTYEIPSKIKYLWHEIAVVGISKFAFKDCNNIESLMIPNSVKYIGCNAFYRCNNLRTIYYLGYLKDLKIEGFSGDYGSVNPIWLCKADIPSWQPKVNFSISEDANNKCVLKVSIGGVAFNLIRVTKTRTSSFFIGETAVTRALWKIIMNDYPDGQNNDRCPIRITYLETGTFISKLNEITQMRFSLPSPFIWLEAAEGNKRRIDYSNIKIIPRDQEYEVKSVRTNDLGLYDMFGPGELCDKEELIGSSIIPSHYAPLMGYEILDKVDDRIGIADPQNERYAFRLYLSCENTLLDKYRIY